MKSENKKNFSEIFKEKRQSKNLSLEKLSEITKIQLYYLEALETGHFEKLPSSIYRNGILKRISKFLEIDENKIAETYGYSAGSVHDNVLFQSGVRSINKRKSYFILTPNKLMIFFGGFLLMLFSGYFWYQFNFLVGPPSIAVEPGKNLITKDENILVSGKTDGGINLTINSENVYVAPNGDFKKDIKLAAGINIIEIKAVNNFGKEKKIIRQIFREVPSVHQF